MLSGDSSASSEELMIGDWKVLIYDRAGRDILLPLFSVAELRNLGITLHLLLHSDREPIPDSPAVYFVNPTPENLQRISRDLKEALYESFELNFISPIKRDKLEDLAQASLSSDSAHLISKIYDQYTNFVSLENKLFILRHQQRDAMCYYNLNRNTITDSEINSATDQIVDGLFSMLVSIGMVPFIRAQCGGIAEFVAQKLDQKVRDNLRDSRNSLFQQDAGALTFNRPLLLLLDRNFDLATPLAHSWTYQALIHDVLETGLNSVTLNTEEKKSSYDLSEMDSFWMEHRLLPIIPNVAEAIHKETEACTREENAVKDLKKGMDSDNVDLEDSTNKLTNAIESLPQILERKRRANAHTTIATSILDQLKLRGLQALHQAEDKIRHGGRPEKAILDMLKDESIGEPDGADKLRLLLVYLLSNESVAESVDSLESPLKEAGIDSAAVSYIRKLQVGISSSSKNESKSGWGNKAFNLASTFHKNIIGSKNQVKVTRALDQILTSEADEYRYFDPKIMRPTESMPKSKQPISQAIVFMIGGGSYIEYQNLMEYEESRKQERLGGQNISVIYGATEMPTPNDFLKYLTKLGNESI